MTRILCWLAAFVVAALGAVFGSWVGWLTAPALISAESATVIAESAFPNQVRAAERTDALFPFAPSVDGSVVTAILGGDGYGPGTVEVRLALGPTSAQAAEGVGAAAQALAASGWSVREFRARGGYDAFTAERDGVAVNLRSRDASTFVLRVGRAQPVWVPLLAVVGALLGAMAGWVWARWLTSRASRRSVAVALCLAGLVLVLPALALGALAVGYAGVTGSDPWAPAWLGFTTIGLRPLAWLAALLAATSTLIGVARQPVRR